MHKNKRHVENATSSRWPPANDDYVMDEEHRNDRLLTWVLIVTLVLGIAAMSIDYLWKIVPHNSVSVSKTDSPATERVPSP
jgi:hypothetical protein